MLEVLKAVVAHTAIEHDVEEFALHDVRPGAVVSPASIEEAAALIRLANEQKWRVEFAGAMSWPVGNRRTRADLIISSRRLDRVVEYEPADLVAGVQAGMPLHALQQHTHKNMQFLALDPPGNERSSIGGIIAAGRAGPQRLGYGTARDHVLGLQMITGDGRVLNIGGRVVKNVAGYDLVRLLTGSAGTLGMITQAFVRLRPLPQADESMLVRGQAAEPLLELADFIVQKNLEAVALELIGGWTLLIRLHGNTESVIDARTRIAAHCAAAHLVVEPGTPKDWRALADRELAAQTIVRLADLPSRLSSTLSLAQKLVTRSGAAAQLVAHAGDGIVRVLLDAGDPEATAFAIGEARTTAGVSGASVIMHSRSGELMRRVDAYGGGGNTLPLMAKLKDLFDPGGILAPGRFVV